MGESDNLKITLQPSNSKILVLPIFFSRSELAEPPRQPMIQIIRSITLLTEIFEFEPP